MKRLLLSVMLLLIAGAIINVAVAWGCSRWSRFSEAGQLDELETFDLFENRKILRPNRRLDGHWIHGFGLSMSEASVSGQLDHEPRAAYIMVFDAGWPCRSLRAEWRGVDQRAEQLPSSVKLYTGLESFERVRDGQFHFGNFVYPTAPLWPGFAINTILYAAVSGIMAAFPFVFRRWLRRRHGLCRECAYPFDSNERCTECGGTTPIRRGTT